MTSKKCKRLLVKKLTFNIDIKSHFCENCLKRGKEMENNVQQEINSLVEKAKKALVDFEALDQEKIDYIVAKQVLLH